MKKLGYNTQEEGVYKANLKRLDALSKQLHTLGGSIITIANKEEFLKQPLKYVINEYRKKSGLDISDAKLITMYELPVDELIKVELAYFTQKRNVPNTQPDFNIYSVSKEHELLFERLEVLAKSLNDLNALSDTNAIQRATRNAIQIYNGKWQANPHYIG